MDLNRASANMLRERIRVSNGKLTINLNRLPNVTSIKTGENLLHTISGCFINGSISNIYLPTNISISSSRHTKFGNLQFNTRKSAKEFLGHLRSKWDFAKYPNFIISHFVVLEEHHELHAKIVSSLREQYNCMVTRYTILQQYFFVPEMGEDGNDSDFLSNYRNHPISLYTLKDVQNKRRKYFMNGSFESEDLQSKFSPDNYAGVSTREVTRQMYTAYKQDGESMQLDDEWITYSIPSLQTPEQHNDNQQNSVEEGELVEDHDNQHNRTRGQGRGRGRGTFRGRGRGNLTGSNANPVASTRGNFSRFRN